MLRTNCRTGGRLSRFLLAAATLFMWMALTPVASTSQATDSWDFVQDPFTDLWFHGLALVGYNGFGATPLYDPEYAWNTRTTRRDAGVDETELERRRGALNEAFHADVAYEVLHFVPLYVSGAPVGDALDALDHRATARVGRTRNDPAAAQGASVVDAILQTPVQHATLEGFVDALREEWRLVTSGAADWRERVSLAAYREEWNRLADGGLATFLAREGLTKGRVVLTPALGAEGRTLVNGDGALVVVGAAGEPASVAGSILRELCFPAVRRALAPFETRLEDRYVASNVSEQSATRCGELLLEAHAPGYLESFRSRFGVITAGAGFLSAAGFSAGVAALEREIEHALRRELHLDSDDGRLEDRPVGRQP